MTTAGWVLTLFYGAIALFFVGAGTWAAIDFVKRRIEDNRFNRRLAAAKNSEQFLDVLMEVSGYFGGLIADEFDVRYVYNERLLKNSQASDLQIKLV